MLVLSASTTVFISDLLPPSGTTFGAGLTDLLAPLGSFTLEDIRNSTDLESNVTGGTVNVIDSKGNSLSTIKNVGLGDVSSGGDTIFGDLTIQGDTIGNTIVGNVFSGGTFYGNGLNLSGITTETNFNAHTGDTNNPHQTSFSNLTATAHTHAISDILNLQTELSNKYDKSGGTITGDVTINQDLRVEGDFTVIGSATTIHSEVVEIADNIITLNSNVTAGTPTENAGIDVRRGDEIEAQIRWNESEDKWLFNFPISASTYFGDGSNLTGITDLYVTGGTLNGNTLELTRNDDVTVSVNLAALATDTFVTGFTYSPTTNTFSIKRNNGNPDLDVLLNTLSGLTINGNLTVTGNTTSNKFTGTIFSGGTFYGDGSNLTGITATTTDTFVTGATFNDVNSILTLTRNDDVDVNVNLSGLTNTDIYVTASTLSGNTLVLTRNDDTNIFTDLSQFANVFDVFVTGGTYDSISAITFINNTGGTFTVTGITNTDTFVTGGTIVNNTTLRLQRNDDIDIDIDVSSLIFSGDTFVTGGTYNKSTGIATFSNNIGGTFNVTGVTDNFTTGVTLINNTLYFDRNDNLSAYTVDLSSLVTGDNTFVTGGTIVNDTTLRLERNDDVNVDIDVSSLVFSADTYVTGSTLSGNTLVLRRNDDAIVTQDLSQFLDNTDTFVTGGTYNGNNGIITFTNNTGGTFTVTGITDSDIYVTGGSIVNNTTLRLGRNDDADVDIDVSSLIFSGDTFVTGGTYTKSTGIIELTNNLGNSFNITGATDNFTTGVTLINNALYFDRNDSLSAYTVDLSSLVSGSDKFVTGATVTGGTTLVLTRNDGVKVSTPINDYTTLSANSIYSTLLNLTPTTGVTEQEGLTFYDQSEHSLSVKTDITGVTHNLGQEHFIRVKNNSGSIIPNGSAVYIDGTDNNRPTIALAKSDSIATSTMIGLTTHDIGNGEEGFVTTEGLVRDVDTSSFTEGDTLYLSQDVAGGWVSISPPIKVDVGIVVKSDASEGVILVTKIKIARQNNVIVVRSLNDLPEPVSSEIQTEDSVVYQFVNSVNIEGNTLLMGDNTAIIGNSRFIDSIIYTGTGATIKSRDKSGIIDSINISATNGSIFDFEDTSGNEKSSIIKVKDCRVTSANSLGSIKNLKIFKILNNLINNTSTNGFDLGGTQNGDILIFDNIVSGVTGTLFNFNSGGTASVWDVIQINRNQIHVDTGQYGISGDTDNGNLSTDGRGKLQDNSFLDGGTYISGITKADTKWTFLGNSQTTGSGDTSNSVAIGFMSLEGNTTDTSISSQNTWTKVEGTTDAGGNMERFTMPSDNRLTYTGLERRAFNIACTLACEGQSKNYEFTIFQNNAKVANISVETFSESSKPSQVAFIAPVNAVTNDYFEVFVRNLEGDDDIIVTHMQVSIQE